MTTEISVAVPSNVFNTLNYLLFDLAFSGAIHILTSDIAGLTNCSTVLSFSREEIGARKAPFAGSGITCTKRNVFYMIASLRFVSWLLIFATTFFIRGKSYPVIVEKQASVVSKGTASVFQDTPVIDLQRTLRLGCQGRTESGIYYGEIRDGECELDLNLLTKPVIKFGLDYEPTMVTTQSCNQELYNANFYNCTASASQQEATILCLLSMSRPGTSTCAVLGETPIVKCSISGRSKFSCALLSPSKQQSSNQTVQYNCKSGYGLPKIDVRCKNAVVGCYKDADFECEGSVLVNNKTYICKNMRPENMTNEKILCKRVFGVHWNIGDDVLLYGTRTTADMESVYAALYGSGVKQRLVKMYDTSKRKNVTKLSPLWFVILGVKMMLVAILLMVIFRLRCVKGLCRVANDEQRMKRLLLAEFSQTVSRNPLDGFDDSDIYVALISDEPRLIAETMSDSI